jgi:hypothetical protein
LEPAIAKAEPAVAKIEPVVAKVEPVVAKAEPKPEPKPEPVAAKPAEPKVIRIYGLDEGTREIVMR